MNYEEKVKFIGSLKDQLNGSSEELGFKGLTSDSRVESLARQLFDSIRRVDYIYKICTKEYSGESINPSSRYFDPYKLISNFVKKQDYEEAYWLCFLTTYCGKNLKNGWGSLSAIYGGDTASGINSWLQVSNNEVTFFNWLDSVGENIKTGFGNHRKYETFKSTPGKGPRAVIHSYLNLMKLGGGTISQVNFFSNCKEIYTDDPEDLFDALYKIEASKILRFGRLSKFDYLTLLTKVGLINLEPPEAYISTSTGPKAGLALLFLNNSQTSKPAAWHKTQMNTLKSLELGPLKMQVLEDALCNWQKSPADYTAFRG
jgi:hypothetical protein